MKPYYRMAVMVLRFTAAALMLISGMNLALYRFQAHRNHGDMQLGRALYLSIPLVAGLVIMIRSSAWARRLTQDLDE